MANPSKGPKQPGVQTLTRPKAQIKKPPMFRVVLHNDDYTTRDFVVDILQNVFGHAEPVAVRIMLQVHTTGSGTAGVFTREIAEMKVRTVETLARQREFPLRLSVEPGDL